MNNIQYIYIINSSGKPIIYMDHIFNSGRLYYNNQHQDFNKIKDILNKLVILKVMNKDPLPNLYIMLTNNKFKFNSDVWKITKRNKYSII